MAHILLHPGFHKTGTGSVQTFLAANRAALSPCLDMLLPPQLEPVALHCLAFSKHHSALILPDLVATLDTIFVANPELGERDLILSSADLCGHLPGWPGVDTYAVAPFLIECLAGYFAERFSTATVSVVLTTRSTAAWMHSLWQQQLQSRRMTYDFEGFSKRYADVADLGHSVAATATAIEPTPVYDMPLDEALHHPQGPGGAVLELIDLPPGVRAALRPVGVQNRGPDPALTEQFLSLNRSAAPDDAVRRQKDELIRRAKIGGWALRLDTPQAG